MWEQCAKLIYLPERIKKKLYTVFVAQFGHFLGDFLARVYDLCASGCDKKVIALRLHQKIFSFFDCKGLIPWKKMLPSLLFIWNIYEYVILNIGEYNNVNISYLHRLNIKELKLISCLVLSKSFFFSDL